MKSAIITDRQRELLFFIYESLKSTGYPPTFEEMRDGLGVVSNQAIIDLLKKLEGRSMIKRDSSTARSVAILPEGYRALGEAPLVAFLGVSSAGTPLEAVEIKGEWETTSASDVAWFKDKVFLLKVSGDSMINAGIDDGDAVLVKEQKEFVSGEIVLARTGNETTIKRFISEDRPPYMYLKPENPKYSKILFTDDMELTGKVISVLKNGNWKGVQ